MNGRRWRVYGVSALLSLAVAGCGFGWPPGEPPLAETTWVVESYGQHAPLPGTTIRLTFEDERFRGSAGCNQFSGDYAFDDGQLVFGDIVRTLMACESPPGVMEQEQEFTRMLAAAGRADLQDHVLLLITPEGERITMVQTD